MIRNTSKHKVKAPVIRPSLEIAESVPIDHNPFSTHTLARILYQNSSHTSHKINSILMIKKKFQSVSALRENSPCLFWPIQNTLCGQEVEFYF